MSDQHNNFAELSRALAGAEYIRWWIVDPQLKYISIHMDTRENMYVIKDRDQNLIEPQRVIDAITQYRAKFGSDCPTPQPEGKE